ncbi:MAG: META domain-containing protein [Bacteroidales bacterium]|nr:META domain-containing protein [Bacteroidales bacterium]
MKKILTIILMAAMTACGCKSHKQVVVNARAEFDDSQVWQLVAMRGKEISYSEGQKPVTLQINTEAGTFSGHNGCNRYFGTFKDLGNGKMELNDFNATKRACPEAFHKIERSYMQLLTRCDAYELGEYTLRLLQGDKELLTFEKNSPTQ